MIRPADNRSYIGQPSYRRDRSAEGPHKGDRSRRETRDRERSRNWAERRNTNGKPASYAEGVEDDMQICDASSDHGDEAMSISAPRMDRNRTGVRHYERRTAKEMHTDRDGIMAAAGVEPARFRVNEHSMRDGIFYPYDTFYEFLRKWLDTSNVKLTEKLSKTNPKSIREDITAASAAERRYFKISDREDLLHCDLVISGMPPSVFFGSGFGNKQWVAKAAAAKDLMDKCLRIGIITNRLYDSLASEKQWSKSRRIPDFADAVRAVVTMEQFMGAQNWPWDVLLAREQEVETLDRLKRLFIAVRDEVYSRAMDISPNHQEDNNLDPSGGYERRRRDSRDRGERDRERGDERRGERDRERGDERRGERGRDDHPRRQLSPPRRARPEDAYAMNRGRVDPMMGDIELKIAQQREELLRRERAREMIEPLDFEPNNYGEPQWNGPPPPMQPMFFGMPPMGLAPGPPMMMRPPSRDRMVDQRRMEEQQKKDEEERLRVREEQLKLKMEAELEQKRKEMEEKIRRQVQEEERARLQQEFVRQQQAAAAVPFVGQYASHTQAPGYFAAGSGAIGSSAATTSAAMLSVDYEMDEIRKLVKETEEKLIALQQSAQQSTLNAIFESRAFQTVAQLGENANMLDRAQKQQLLRDLKKLLSEAVPEERTLGSGKDRTRERRRSTSRRRSRSRTRSRSRDRRSRRSARSRSRSPRTSRDEEHKEIFVQVGNVTLRNLTPLEQRRLASGDVVIAQDMKNGKWTTAKVSKISRDRVTLLVGNATWKKGLSELYKEIIAIPSVSAGLGIGTY